ncbi:T9SS type A sorting domain-containing protein [bacterium]|nr:T9SS type A sorting domain-containing protein [bacterium]
MRRTATILCLIMLTMMISTPNVMSFDQNALLGDPVIVDIPPANVPVSETNWRYHNPELDEYLGDTITVGITSYDLQHNATVGRMIQYDPSYNDFEGIVYVVYTDLPMSANPIRKIKFNKVFFEDGFRVNDTEGTVVVNDGHWGGFTTLAMAQDMMNPVPIAAYHARSTAQDLYSTKVAVEWTLFPDIFIESDGVPFDEEGQLIWPKSVMDGDSLIHVVSKVSEGNNNIYYSRILLDPVAQSFAMSNPGGVPEVINENSGFISADIAMSPDGERIAICDPVVRGIFNPDVPAEQGNDKDLLVWTNDYRGLDWEFGIDNAMNITNFQGPDLDLLPDTTAACLDTFRLWLESQIYIDHNHTLHAAFSASEYFYVPDQGFVYSQIYYWNEEDQYFVRVADGTHWNNWQVGLGVNNVIVQRPSLYKDPDSGWLWMVFQQYGVPGDTTDAGEALDVSEEGRQNSDIFITASPTGSDRWGRPSEVNGKLWFKPINITNSRQESIAVPPGECRSERDPSISLNNDGEFLHIMYLVDRDAGASVTETPEGTQTENAMMYQRLNKVDMEQMFVDRSEFTPGHPIHVDGAQYWEDPSGWDWEGDVKYRSPELLPNQFELNSVYPNPFNNTTRISFTLQQKGAVELKVFDLLGREVASLLERTMEGGNHQVAFHASDLSSGIYFVQLSSGKSVKSQKMILLK